MGATVDLGTVNLVPLIVVATYNLDLSGRAGPLDKFSVQARVTLGDRGRGALAQRIEDLFLLGVEQYADENYAGAIELWQQVLEIDPRHLAAAKNILTAQEALSLQRGQAAPTAE